MPNPALLIPANGFVLLTTFAAPLFTVPANEENSVCLRLANYTTGAVTATWWLVPSGQGLADRYLRAKDFALAAKEAKDVEIALAMRAGDMLYIAGSAATSIAVSITGTKNSV